MRKNYNYRNRNWDNRKNRRREEASSGWALIEGGDFKSRTIATIVIFGTLIGMVSYMIYFVSYR